MKLTHREVDAIRAERGRSMLLFVTDRCPVGCGHCSVDSRADSPSITDFERFDRIVDWIATNAKLEVIGISGGEPFVERRGLSIATQRFADAGKRQVVFTSGVWATRERVPQWIRAVLNRCDCVYLSTDAFHAKAIDDACLVRAAQTIAAANPWIVLQVLDDELEQERAAKLLEQALGRHWQRHAEINLVTPLTHGRGANVFSRLARVEGRAFGPCSLARSPMVRYDGAVSACCNESVIMAKGPSRLRRAATDHNSLDAATDGFHADSLLRVIGDVGLGVLTQHPRFADLASQRFSNNCDLCWKLLERMPEGSDPLLDAIASLRQDDDL
ncbi:Radical SAM [Enhygromyxa salina]|uniref:Radical SAM n=1 Tax=Enhygromyxa salina TaxID=215803 RepID=A0A0C2A4Q9_9BACT|nr:radical SAM protein [Enhygromyxa salina]KIG18378.1 Radical SAM [Enhygromyxa salina]